MQLEAGKYYKTRDGRKVGPLRCVGFIWYGNLRYNGKLVAYRGSGIRDMGGIDSPDSLVEEWVDSPVLPAPATPAPAASSGAMREKLNSTPYDLVPYQEITDAYSRVAEHGSVKYAAWNWSKGLSRVQLIGSLLRHTFAYLRGQDRDKDSGLLHTDHILWNAVALSHNVHWSLEDGRRVEPEREYKALDNGTREE